MEVVIDSNVLFRTLISKGKITEILFNNKLLIYSPEKLKEEFIKNKEEILSKSKLSETEFNDLSSLIFDIVTFVPLDKYKSFIPKAKTLLGKHTKDEDFIALCLMKNIKLWTYEKFLFKIGFGISTKELHNKLKDL